MSDDFGSDLEMGWNEADPIWSIMTKSRGGTVSVIRDLTLAQARRTYERLDPWYGMAYEAFQVHEDFLTEGDSSYPSGGFSRSCNDGDIEVREVFGPPGWSMSDLAPIKSWPEQRIIWTDANGRILEEEHQDHVGLAAMHKMMRDSVNSDRR